MDNEIKQKLDELRDLMHERDVNPVMTLAAAAAGICNAQVWEVFAPGKSSKEMRHSRYLLWYTLRTSMAMTYAEIARITNELGLEMTPDGIRKGIESASLWIRKEPLWKRRWVEMGRVYNNLNEETT